MRLAGGKSGSGGDALGLPNLLKMLFMVDRYRTVNGRGLLWLDVLGLSISWFDPEVATGLAEAELSRDHQAVVVRPMG